MSRTLFGVPVAAMMSTLLAFASLSSHASSLISFDADSFVHLSGFPITPPDPSLAAAILFDPPAGVGAQGFVKDVFMEFAGTSFWIGAGAASITEAQTRSGLDYYDISLTYYPWDFDFQVMGNVAYVTYDQHAFGKFGKWGSLTPAIDTAIPSGAVIPSVPEPRDDALMVAGLAVVGLIARRKNPQQRKSQLVPRERIRVA